MRGVPRQLPTPRRRVHPATGGAQHGQHHDDGDHVFALGLLEGEGVETETHVPGRHASGRRFRTRWRRHAANENGGMRMLDVV